ncbi:MAG TPA: hypothetical protein GXX55_06820 [Firmicutes bacterium]|nr:hypothetical protein [Bacillota bacterium]
MSKNWRRATLIAVLATFAMLLSSCVQGPPSFNEAQERAAITSMLQQFEKGIEDYDMDKMLGSLTQAFSLVLEEGGKTFPKNYSTLRGELESDRDNQLYWRQQYQYALDLRLDRLTVKVTSANSAEGSALFSVVEKASGIAPITTDSGAIRWQFAKLNGSWKITTMNTHFATLPVPQKVHSQEVQSRQGLPGKNPFFGR